MSAGRATRANTTRAKATRGKATRGKATRAKATRGKATRANTMTDTLVFVGPTLAADEVRARLPHATVLPPAAGVRISTAGADNVRVTIGC